jgi:hypothetical protein
MQEKCFFVGIRPSQKMWVALASNGYVTMLLSLYIFLGEFSKPPLR